MKNKSSADRELDDRSTSMMLTSPDFSDGGAIPLRCVCRWLGGEDRPPQLHWTHVPPGTESFTLIMDDDTLYPGDKATRHWAVFNIPASATAFPPPQANTAGGGIIEGRNYTHAIGYAGPCPSGAHRYTFTLFALNAEMPVVSEGAEYTRSEFSNEFAGAIIASATLTGRYAPSKARRLLRKVKKAASLLRR